MIKKWAILFSIKVVFLSCPYLMASGFKNFDLSARAATLAGAFTARADDASAVDAARKLKCPVIFVHGRLDTTVPFSQVEEIHDAAAGPKKMIRLWTDHGGVQMWCNDRLMKQMRMLVEMAADQDRGRERK